MKLVSKVEQLQTRTMPKERYIVECIVPTVTHSSLIKSYNGDLTETIRNCIVFLLSDADIGSRLCSGSLSHCRTMSLYGHSTRHSDQYFFIKCRIYSSFKIANCLSPETDKHLFTILLPTPPCW